MNKLHLFDDIDEDEELIEELLIFEDLEDLEELEQPLRAPVWRRYRLNPLSNIPNDREFKLRYRFNKTSVEKLVALLKPYLKIPETNMSAMYC